MRVDAALRFIIQTLRTTNTLLRESRRLFRPHGLTEAQFNVLNILASDDEGFTQRALSDYLVVDRSNVTGLLDRMEAAGWVRRAAVPGDRRAWRVKLTTSGRRLWQAVAPLYEKAVFDAVRPIGAAHVQSATAVLAQLEERARKIAPTFEKGRL